MTPQEYLQYKARNLVTLVRKINTTTDDKGVETNVPDPDTVIVTPQEFDPLTGAKGALQPIEFSLSGMDTDINNAEIALTNMRTMRADLGAVK